ncbi:hypothetical protein ABBQ38_010320 [Trebouxia sp. C0009 RCD-2024]
MLRCQHIISLVTAFLVVIVTTNGLSDSLSDSLSDQALIPGRSLDTQLLLFGGDAVRYSLQQLKPNTGYEVRVSYPATVPSKVTLQLISGSTIATPARHSAQAPAA